jgi:hypothetical protein
MTFAYKVFQADRVVEMFGLIPDAGLLPAQDSYLASDASTDAIQAALREGYRWVRTDGDLAIFEQESRLTGLLAGASLRDCSCGAKPGQRHKPGCNVERCSVCGRIKSNCDCLGHDPSFARWTGVYPGELEAAALGIDANEFERSGLHQIFFVKPGGGPRGN